MQTDPIPQDHAARTGVWAAYRTGGQRLAEWMGIFSMSLAIVYVVCITLNVLMRYLFNAPLAWVSDMGFIFLPLIMAPCLGVAAARGMLIVITFAGDHLSPANRVRLLIATRIVTTVFLGLIAWKMGSYGLDIVAEKRSTMQLEVPLGPVWIAVAAAFVLAVPLVLAQPLEQPEEARDG